MKMSESKWRGMFSFLLLFILVFVIVPVTYALKQDKQKDEPSQAQYVKDDIIIKFRNSQDESAKQEFQNILGAHVVRRLSLIEAELWHISKFSVEEAVQKFSQDPRVEYIEPDFIYRMNIIPNDPYFEEWLWNMHNTGMWNRTPDADIDAPEAWDVETGGPIVIGIIDSGIDYNHGDLVDNMWINNDEIPNNQRDDDHNGLVDDYYGYDFATCDAFDIVGQCIQPRARDSDPIDENGHGTMVAGIIGAKGNNGLGVAGVNWNARLMALKHDGASGESRVSDSIDALDYAIDNGAQLTNNSYGSPSYSSAFNNAISLAKAAGQLFIAPAGNGGADYIGDDNDITPEYPASYTHENIISVAATSAADELTDYSNFGRTSVDVGAPGGTYYPNEIISTNLNNSYEFSSGTSLAAPMVSGIVSLIWSQNPTWTYTQVRDHLFVAVDPLPSLDGKTVTGGRVNAWKAVLSPCTPPPTGDWIITKSCFVTKSLSFNRNITIQNNSTVLVGKRDLLDVDFFSKKVFIESGSKLFIENGGKIE